MTTESITKTDSLLSYLSEHHLLTKPVLLQHFLTSWPPAHWTLDTLQKSSKGQQIEVKVGKPYTGGRVPLESECEIQQWDMSELCEKIQDHNNTDRFYYAAYHYLNTLDQCSEDMLRGVDWDWTGLQGLSAKDSTFWMGSAGSFTPCHRDSYGYNLHAQITGKKEWILWPPDTPLHPTRIPYEESTIFAGVDVLSEPWYSAGVRIVLEPGDVLVVPKHWWHLVRSLESSVSVNTWVQLDSDRVDRVEEAIARLLVCSLKSMELGQTSTSTPASSAAHCTGWLNPGETATPPAVNIEYLTQALSCVGQSDNQDNEQYIVKTGSDAHSYSIISNASDSWKLQKIFLPKPAVTSSEHNCVTRSQSMVDRLLNAILDPDILTAIASKLTKSGH